MHDKYAKYGYGLPADVIKISFIVPEICMNSINSFELGKQELYGLCLILLL
jgi:hypothetical protein